MASALAKAQPTLDERFDTIWWVDPAGRITQTEPPDAVVPEALAQANRVRVVPPPG